MDAKKCRTCKQVKSIEEFGYKMKCGISTGLIYATCIPCRTREREQTNTPEAKEKRKEYTQKHAVRKNEKLKEWREKNKEHIQNYSRHYHETHKEERCQKSREYNEKTARKTWSTNLIKKLDTLRRKDEQKGREFNLTKEYVNTLIGSSCDKCHWCECDVMLVDYEAREPLQWSIDRLNNSLGHIEGNVVLSCMKCNLDRR